MKHNHLFQLAILAAIVSTMALSSVAVFGQVDSRLTVEDTKSAKPKPAPRMGGHPDLSGYWKGTRDTRPGGTSARIFRDGSCR